MEYFERLKTFANLKQKLENMAEELGKDLPEHAEKSLAQLATVKEAESLENLAEMDADLAHYGNLERLERFGKRVERLIKNSDRIMEMRKFISSLPLPEYERTLTFEAEALGAKLTPEALLAENTNIDIIYMEFERLRHDFAEYYVKEHNSYQDDVRNARERLENADRKATALEKLSPFLQFRGTKVLIADAKKAIKNVKACRDISVSDFLDSMRPYHSCNFRPDEKSPVDIFLELEDDLDMAYKKMSRELSERLSHAIIKDQDRDDIDKLTDSLRVADLEKLPEILSDDMISLLKRILS